MPKPVTNNNPNWGELDKLLYLVKWTSPTISAHPKASGSCDRQPTRLAGFPHHSPDPEARRATEHSTPFALRLLKKQPEATSYFGSTVRPFGDTTVTG